MILPFLVFVHIVNLPPIFCGYKQVKIYYDTQLYLHATAGTLHDTQGSFMLDMPIEKFHTEMWGKRSGLELLHPVLTLCNLSELKSSGKKYKPPPYSTWLT